MKKTIRLGLCVELYVLQCFSAAVRLRQAGGGGQISIYHLVLTTGGRGPGIVYHWGHVMPWPWENTPGSPVASQECWPNVAFRGGEEDWRWPGR